MKEYFIFYILLIVLIVLLIFVILLYSDYHSRTIVPALLSTNYKVSEITGDWNTMKIANDFKAVDGSLLLSEGVDDPTNNYANVSFVPMAGDEERKISGMMILLMGSSSTSGDTIRLRMVDNTTGDIIGKESQFFLPSIEKWGLTPIRLNFRSGETNARHQFVVEALSPDGDKSTVRLNSAYISYY